MPRYHRVVWSEGLFLTPHHFQQWDLYQEEELIERTALTVPHPWGVFSMEVDAKGVADGTFRLLAFRGVFRNGVTVRIPEVDPPPAGVSFKEAFDIRTNQLDIYLGLPDRWTDWPNCLLPGARPVEHRESRYQVSQVSVADDNSGTNEREIGRAEKRLKILLPKDIRNNFNCIRVAQLERTGANSYGAVETFVPPCLTLRASDRLKKISDSLLARLVRLTQDLMKDFSEPGADVTPTQARNFLRFAIVNGAIPQWTHLCDLEVAHPERLYMMLSGLLGALATFDPERVDLRSFPAYDHENLGPVFSKLVELAVGLLSKERERYVAIHLEAVGHQLLQAELKRDSFLEPATPIYLAVSSPEGNVSNIKGVKIAAPEQIHLLGQLDGVTVQYDPAPVGLPPRGPHTAYHRLIKAGSLWDGIREARALVVDISGVNLNDPQLELLVLPGGMA